MRIKFANIIKTLYFYITVLFVVGIFVAFTQNPHSISPLIAVAFNLALVVFVYSRGKDKSVNKTFASWSCAVAVLNFSLFGFYIAPNITFLSYWTKVFRIGLIFVSPTFLHFTLRLIRNKNKIKEKILYAGYGLSIIFWVLNWFGLFENRFIKTEWKYTTEPGIMYLIFLGYLALFAVYALFEVFKEYKKSDSILIRNQLRYVFFAGSVALIIGFTNLLLSFGIEIYPLGPLGYIAYTGIIAYAIVRHQLMDIRIIIRRSVIYAALTAALTGIYVLVVGFCNGVLGITKVAYGDVWSSALAAMIIAASFQPLKNKIQFIVDKLFFREKYDYQNTLKELSGALGSIVELDRLLSFIVDNVTTTMHIDKGSIMLTDGEEGSFKIKAGRGLNREVFNDGHFQNDAYLIKKLAKEKTIFMREEAELRFEGKTEGLKETIDKLKKIEATLSIPLIARGKLIGIFNLSNKMSGDMFSPEDLQLLSTIANQAAIAIENDKLYIEIREMEKNLHRADKLAALGTMASGIAHEIKNPLVSIKTFTQLMPQRFENPQFRDKFNNIVPQELERLENVLNDLLNLSRPSPPKFQPTKIEKVIESILTLMNNEVSRHQVNLIKNYDKSLPEVRADAEQLKQVFMNLILNAIHAMPKGGSLTITTATANDSIKISFADTGEGIPKENLINLFNPFFTTKSSGSGLGLSISKRIIEEHNGKITVESEINKGTTFTITLPVSLET